MQNYKLETFKFQNHTLELYTLPGLFRPNAVTTRFTRAVEGLYQATVFDIGTGIGPLAIWAGLEGAKEVYAVDPVPEHIKVARLNIKKYGLEEKVHAYEGNIFSTPERSLEGIRADIIMGDVSSIACEAARVLGWYPDNVPTGGYDGADIGVGLLEHARHFLAENGIVYFAIAIGLSNYERIIDAANRNFNNVEAVNQQPLFIPFENKDDVAALESAYECKPDFIKILEQRGRFGWQGQMYKASNPK